MDETGAANRNGVYRALTLEADGGEIDVELLLIPDASPAKPVVPWYQQEVQLDPRVFGIGKTVKRFLAITLPLISLYCVSIKPVWQLGWRVPFYAMSNFMPVRSASGQTFAGAVWFRGKEIRIYREEVIGPYKQQQAVADMEQLIDDLGLDFTVKAMPLPEDAKADLDAATVREGTNYALDFQKLTALRLDHRGQQYAEIFLTGMKFAESGAQGKTFCGAGIVALRPSSNPLDNVFRHEGAHLLGYDKHDDFPFYVIGYPEFWIPDSRDTMMMHDSAINHELSPRAKDALHYLWIGLQERDGIAYFKR
jgi:hypothetical protein